MVLNDADGCTRSHDNSQLGEQIHGCISTCTLQDPLENYVKLKLLPPIILALS